jgi:hypothetical protein
MGLLLLKIVHKQNGCSTEFYTISKAIKSYSEVRNIRGTVRKVPNCLVGGMFIEQQQIHWS